MRELTIYEASDGCRFDTEQECRAHELSISLPDDIMKHLLTIQKMCENTTLCTECKFSDADAKGNGYCLFCQRGSDESIPQFWNFDKLSPSALENGGCDND